MTVSPSAYISIDDHVCAGWFEYTADCARTLDSDETYEHVVCTNYPSRPY